MSVLRIRKRPDLIIEPQQASRRRHWVVKDPVTLRYCRLRDEEHTILQLLDGQTSLDEIKRHFEQAFVPLRTSLGQIQAFVIRLHQLGLVIADSPGQGETLRRRGEASERIAWTQRAANLLALRLSPWRAGPLLRWLSVKFGWMFSAPALTAGVALMLTALALVLAEFGAFQAKLPNWESYFQARSLLWLIVAMAAAKVLHELAHGVTCWRVGGECHDMGVMLLILMPCLYCDVSDLWRVESRWRRIAVSAAGMLAELLLASVCTLLWWLSEPGLFHAICLRLMIVCSFGTVFINANPLLRYDGYYILSDLLDLPNLWQDARSTLGRAVARWTLGLEPPEDPTIPSHLRGLLLLYAVASMVYRAALVAAIAWLGYRGLEGQGGTPLALFIVAGALFGAATPVAQSVRRILGNPMARRQIRRGRASFTVLMILAAVLALLFVPLPHRIETPMWLEPQGADFLYVSTPGSLRKAVSPGEQVKRGQTLAELSNPELARQLASLDAEVRAAGVRLKNLRLLLSEDPSAAPLIPAAEESLKDAQQRREQLQQDQRRLAIESPRDGTVLPPPRTAPPGFGSRQLGAWHGTPLDRQNLGCHLEAGTLLCLVGDRAALEAILLVEQSDIPLVRLGQRVRLAIDQPPALVLEGMVAEIASSEAELPYDALALALDLPQRTSAYHDTPAWQRRSQVRVELDPHHASLLIGSCGRAKIIVEPQSLAVRMSRFVQRTFSLP